VKRSKKPWIVLLVVVSLYSGVELFVFVTGYAGTFHTVRRMAAAAPAVEWQGARLAYVGTERLSNTDRVELSRAENDSEIMLYKIAYARTIRRMYLCTRRVRNTSNTGFRGQLGRCERSASEMRKHPFIYSLLILLLATGCAPEGQTATSASFAQEKAVMFAGKMYAGSDEPVTDIGDQIGVIDHQITQESEEEHTQGNYSNYYPAGTKVYEVKRKPVSEGIALEIGEREYVEVKVFPTE